MEDFYTKLYSIYLVGLVAIPIMAFIYYKARMNKIDKIEYS